MRHFVLALFGLIFTVSSAPAFAQGLELGDVTRFIAAIDELEARGDAELGDWQARVDAADAAEDLLDEWGHVALYRRGYEELATPEEKLLLDSVFLGAGFERYEDWRLISDLIFAAYLKLQSERGAFTVISGLSEEQLAIIAPEMVGEVRKLKVFFPAAEKIGSDDLAIVRPYLNELEVAMEDEFSQ